MRSVAVNPSRARSAASTPASAARPAWNGFVIVPKFSRSPPPELAAIASARSVGSSIEFVELRGRERTRDVRRSRWNEIRADSAAVTWLRRPCTRPRRRDGRRASSRAPTSRLLGDRERGRQARCRGMGQQPVHAIGADGELRVVVVVRVHADAVRERCEARWHSQARSR